MRSKVLAEVKKILREEDDKVSARASLRSKYSYKGWANMNEEELEEYLILLKEEKKNWPQNKGKRISFVRTKGFASSVE